MFEKLGKFEIKKVLGNGAMGEVYLGLDPAIGREVAIKTILPSNAGGPEAKERFAREAMAAGVLNHPNLVTIYEFGEDQGVLYIAMEFVRGHDLEELMRDQSLTQSELLEILAQVCDGLDFAHRQHIVHRDIKPSNVRVSRDGKKIHTKVMDFGVARVGNSDMTATGMVMGTVSYMAPEYIRTGKPDPRSDLFAIGVMLYEGFSGRKPFAGDTTPTILYKIVNEPPEPIDLSQLHDISPAITSVLDRALSKDPDIRFQTGEEFARALRAAKDPTWQGQALIALPDATVQLQAGRTGPAQTASHSATVQLAPTLPQGVPPAGPQATASLPGPAASSRKTAMIAAATVLLLSGSAYYFLKGRPTLEATPPSLAQPEPTPSPVQPPSTASPTVGTPSNPASALPLPTQPSLRPETSKPIEPSRPAEARRTEPRAEPQESQANVEEETLRSLDAPHRMSLSLTTLSESIAMADSNPEKALHGIRKAIAANPGNANAYAWGIAILYRQGRYVECRALYHKARREGVAGQLMSNLRFRQMIVDERLSRRIPGGLGGDE